MKTIFNSLYRKPKIGEVITIVELHETDDYFNSPNQNKNIKGNHFKVKSGFIEFTCYRLATKKKAISLVCCKDSKPIPSILVGGKYFNLIAGFTYTLNNEKDEEEAFNAKKIDDI